MPDSIDIVRQMLERYSAERGDVIHLYTFVEYAIESQGGEFAEEDFSSSIIRKAVEELHHNGEIKYVGEGKYRVNYLECDETMTPSSDTTQNNSANSDQNQSVSDDSVDSEDDVTGAKEDTLASTILDDLDL